MNELKAEGGRQKDEEGRPHPSSFPPHPSASSPPSLPTRRSRHARDAIFVVSILAWVVAIYLVFRFEERAKALSAGARELAVFTEAFEHNLKMRFTVESVGGCHVTGEAVRRTNVPYDGKMIVRSRLKGRGTVLWRPAEFEYSNETNWVRSAGGLRSTNVRLRFSAPGLLDEINVRLAVIRHRHTRKGDYIIISGEIAGRPFSKPFKVPKGADLSASFMEAARVRPPYVGARWEVIGINLLSGKFQRAEVEIVEEGPVVATGTGMEVLEEGAVGVRGTVWTGYKAVTRVEKETGRLVEQAVTWYDPEGRALRQTTDLGLFKLTLERIERLPGSLEEWEKMGGTGSISGL